MGYFRGRLHAPRSASRSELAEAGMGAAPVTGGVPAHEEIAKLAYSYWEARGRQGGSAVEDWLHAERELSERRFK